MNRCHWLSEKCDGTQRVTPYYRGQERTWPSEWACHYHCSDAWCECNNCYRAIIAGGGYLQPPRFRIVYGCHTTAFLIPWGDGHVLAYTEGGDGYPLSAGVLWVSDVVGVCSSQYQETTCAIHS